MGYDYDDAEAMVDEEDARRTAVRFLNDNLNNTVTVEVAGFEVPLDRATARRVTDAMQNGDWDEVGRILAGVASDGSIPDHATLREKARLSAQIANLQRKYAELEAIPKEPRPEHSPTGSVVMMFTKTFGGGSSYTFAALSGGGSWYLTGRKAAGRVFTWPELWKFINQGESRTPNVWVANGFSEL